MKSRLYIATLGAAVLLSACGGSDDDIVAVPAPVPAPAPAPVPAPAPTVSGTAGASALALITYLQSLVATGTTDTAEPLELGTFDPTPSLSETDEPIQLTSS